MERTWPMHGGRPRPLAERFWEKVDKSGDCWVWVGARNSYGYGVLQRDGSTVGAHRVSLEMALGRRLTPNEAACHTCDNPPCVRPDHLYVGDAATNIRDAVSRGRWAGAARTPGQRARLSAALRAHYAEHPGNHESARTHCPAGHAYDDANTIHSSQGKRQCRACKRARDNAAYARRAAR